MYRGPRNRGPQHNLSHSDYSAPPAAPRYDGYQNDFPLHPSRNPQRQQPNSYDRGYHSGSHSGYHRGASRHPPGPQHDRFQREVIRPPHPPAHNTMHQRPNSMDSYDGGYHSGRDNGCQRGASRHPPGPQHNGFQREASWQPHPPAPQRPKSHECYADAYQSSYAAENVEAQHQYFDPYTQDPYDLSGFKEQSQYGHNNNHDSSEVTTTQTNDLIMVTKKTAHQPAWVPASTELTQPVVKNKELDDWVPASKTTRVTEQVLDKELYEDEGDEVTPEDYAKWKQTQGGGVKRKIGKQPKGVFTAAGKHPIGALKEKIPTCEFQEEARERNDELRYWKLTASVKFNGYKFIGYGVTIRIAKAEAAIKALAFLDVEGLHEMHDHIGDQYSRKQSIMESVKQEESEESKEEEPWYIKIDDAEVNIPVFKPKELPTPSTHPTMYLHQWYGPDVSSEYEEANPGFRPIIYTCITTVQGQAYEGQGPSKKEAQRITAALILRKLEQYPPPVVNKNRASGKRTKKPKKMGGVSDFPSVPMPNVYPS